MTRPPRLAPARHEALSRQHVGDISDRRYRSLGDISVTVSKWTIFDADPTPAKVNEALQEQAAKLSADAVILVRYGTVGMGMFTWGKLDGNGCAIAFEP